MEKAISAKLRKKKKKTIFTEDVRAIANVMETSESAKNLQIFKFLQIFKADTQVN